MKINPDLILMTADEYLTAKSYPFDPRLRYDKSSEWMRLKFQTGPIREAGMNGIQIEDVLLPLIDRLREFQAGQFSCRENGTALEYLVQAYAALESRTARRMLAGIEGTNKEIR